MKASECEVHDIITYNADRCVVKAISGDIDNRLQHANQARNASNIHHCMYVVMVERPRKLIPKGREFRVYRIQKQQCGTGGRKVIAARGLTYPEAEAFRDAQPVSDEFDFLVCNGKIKPNQW
jgi:hypothetical protein